jgi:DNA gyrase/topoisomerase IV subunit A
MISVVIPTRNRSELLINVTRSTSSKLDKEGNEVISFERGSFNGFHRKSKKLLYMICKKDFNNYDAVKRDFFGEFGNHFTVDKEEYEDKKRNYLATDSNDLIQKEDMVVICTLSGYIKRVPLASYRNQKRGGKGRNTLAAQSDDVATQVFVGTTHTPMLFFSSTGQVYCLKLYKIPLGSPQSKGRALVNLFPNLKPGETINNIEFTKCVDESKTLQQKWVLLSDLKKEIDKLLYIAKQTNVSILSKTNATQLSLPPAGILL